MRRKGLVMGSKYRAELAFYPFKGYYDHSIQHQRFIPFIFALLKAARKYPIINIEYRNLKGEEK